MDKTIFFQQLIKDKRKLLISKGYNPATLTLWQQGKRYPLRENAQKLAKLLKMDLDYFPYIDRFVRNK